MHPKPLPFLPSLLRLTGILLLLCGPVAMPQIADFQIVWVVVGDVAAGAGNQPARAGRNLFMASDIADLSLKQIKVAQVTAEPAVTSAEVGDRFCLSSLVIAALGPDRAYVEGAPLSVSVRQDHRDSLRLDRRRNDICVRPSEPGEYPIRFASLLPADDGSMRGAQVFIRVTADEDVASDGPSLPDAQSTRAPVSESR